MPVKLGFALAGAALDGASLEGASLEVAADGVVVVPEHAATTIAKVATITASRGDQLLGARDMRIFLHCARGPRAASHCWFTGSSTHGHTPLRAIAPEA